MMSIPMMAPARMAAQESIKNASFHFSLSEVNRPGFRGGRLV